MSVGFPPVGRCIYCGMTEPPLYREHIVPFGLEGTGALPEASCGACAKITGGLEGLVLGRMLGPFRHAANFRSRKNKRRPKDLPLKVYHGDDEEEIPLSREDYPIALNLPVFPIARLLRGLPPDQTGETVDGGWWHWIDTERVQKLNEKHGIDTMHVGSMEPLSYARFMAKIAHCCTVAELGVDGFTPVTVDLILGRSDAMNYWVGCGGFENPPNPDDVLHASIRRDHIASGMVVQIIQLFATIDAPAYHVVTGFKPGGHLTQTH